jgi:hypothetical protein
MADDRPKLVIKIKDGQILVDSIGFVGDECADEAITKELRRRGRLIEHERKRDVKKRPVRDTSVVDVNI